MKSKKDSNNVGNFETGDDLKRMRTAFKRRPPRLPDDLLDVVQAHVAQLKKEKNGEAAEPEPNPWYQVRLRDCVVGASAFALGIVALLVFSPFRDEPPDVESPPQSEPVRVASPERDSASSASPGAQSEPVKVASPERVEEPPSSDHGRVSESAREQPVKSVGSASDKQEEYDWERIHADLSLAGSGQDSASEQLTWQDALAKVVRAGDAQIVALRKTPTRDGIVSDLRRLAKDPNLDYSTAANATRALFLLECDNGNMQFCPLTREILRGMATTPTDTGAWSDAAQVYALSYWRRNLRPDEDTVNTSLPGLRGTRVSVAADVNLLAKLDRWSQEPDLDGLHGKLEKEILVSINELLRDCEGTGTPAIPACEKINADFAAAAASWGESTKQHWREIMGVQKSQKPRNRQAGASMARQFCKALDVGC